MFSGLILSIRKPIISMPNEFDGMINDEIKTKPNIAKRFFAGLIDYSLIYVFCFFIILNFGTADLGGTYHLNGWPTLMWVFVWGFLTVFLEQLFGATLGNSVMNLKPIPCNTNKTKLSFLQSFKRHLLDPIDMLFFGLVAYITINKTEYNQRLGDLWAETKVVKLRNEQNSII